MKRIFVIAAFAALLGGCSSNSDREIQHDPSGTDMPLKSPCVCNQIPYSAPTFQWVG